MLAVGRTIAGVVIVASIAALLVVLVASSDIRADEYRGVNERQREVLENVYNECMRLFNETGKCEADVKELADNFRGLN